MQNVYSVGQINAYIKHMFTQDFVLRRIYIRGEVSNCKYHTSGHLYFSLKDETGSISCIMFAGSRKGLAFSMQNGQQVIVLGNVNVYERDGTYQLYANEIILDGAGRLYEKLKALKRELEERGMFAQEHNQPIPKHIRTLGVVTAPTGAAIRDIINISKRRNPYIQLVLYPALVQGEGAADSIVKGIQLLDTYGVDVMIVGRGGGSMEDLWAFNEEKVATAIFQSMTPVISAVGHETDTTISDFAADLRAPTPSAAAELAVEDIRKVQEDLEGYRMRLGRCMQDQLYRAREKVRQLDMRLRYGSPQGRMQQMRQYLMEREDRLERLMEQNLEHARHRLRLYVERMKGLSPLEKLQQGYAFVADQGGEKVCEIAQVQEGETLQIYISDGRICAQVLSVDHWKREEDRDGRKGET